MKAILLLLAVTATALGQTEKVRYDGYSLYRITPATDDAVSMLKDLENSNENLNFWNTVRRDQFLNVAAPPQQKESFSQMLTDNNIHWEITIEDVQTAIEAQVIQHVGRNTENFDWTAYHTLDDIYIWLDHIAAAFPDVVTIVSAGRSVDGRDLKGVKISHGPGRKGIFIEGGIHAREWISPAVVTYITNELLTSDFPETVAAANDFDWYIFPVTNPDGYIRSHDVDRMWRKNTRPLTQTALGVDLNRNWNSHWNEAGTSSNPAAQTYPGNGPFSEFEARTLSAYIAEVAPTLDIYLSFHSFSQMLLLPYGHTTDHLDNYWEAVTIGRRAMGSLAVRYGTQYVVGNTAETIYLAAGTSIDWVKARFQVPYVACYELRDRGNYGFLLPAEQIIPSGEETMDSVLAIIREGRFLGLFLNE